MEIVEDVVGVVVVGKGLPMYGVVDGEDAKGKQQAKQERLKDTVAWARRQQGMTFLDRLCVDRSHSRSLSSNNTK